MQRRKNGLLYRRARKLGVVLVRKGGTGNRGITAELYIKLRRRLGLEHTGNTKLGAVGKMVF